MEVTNSEGFTPLHLACRQNLFDGSAGLKLIKVLVEYGGDIDAKDPNGVTPVLIAFNNKQTSVVRYLLEQRPNVEVVDVINGLTPFHIACREGYQAIAESLLFDHGAKNFETKDSNGLSPLHYLSRKGWVKVSRQILNLGASPTNDQYQYTPLHIAILHGHLKLGTLLVQLGASVNATDASDCTPLHTTATRGEFKLAQFLLYQDASVMASSNSGMTPLHCAC